MTKPKQKRIYRYYNDILVDVIDDTYLHKLDKNRAVNVIDELEKNGTYRQGEIMYSLKSISSDTNTTNIYNA
jgi:DNA-binding HxlR family transcriptional regulator